MKYTTLPGTGIKISKICLGTMTWGQQNTEAEGHEQMDYALDQGINFFAENWSNIELQLDGQHLRHLWELSQVLLPYL